MISYFFFLGCLFGWSACKEDANAFENQFISEKIKVQYSEIVCCENLIAVEKAVTGPDDCPENEWLFASNLEDFNIPQRFNFGDTFFITYQLMPECEAETPKYDCPISCDRRHGIPIKILSLE